MTSSPPHFKPIYADIWQHDVDDWDLVNPMECYRFKSGFVRLSNSGYWFPYRSPIIDDMEPRVVEVNLVKPHVLV